MGVFCALPLTEPSMACMHSACLYFPDQPELAPALGALLFTTLAMRGAPSQTPGQTLPCTTTPHLTAVSVVSGLGPTGPHQHLPHKHTWSSSCSSWDPLDHPPCHLHTVEPPTALHPSRPPCQTCPTTASGWKTPWPVASVRRLEQPVSNRASCFNPEHEVGLHKVMLIFFFF